MLNEDEAQAVLEQTFDLYSEYLAVTAVSLDLPLVEESDDYGLTPQQMHGLVLF